MSPVFLISFGSCVNVKPDLTKAQRKAELPKARPTRTQLGFLVSVLELVKADLDPTEITIRHLKKQKHLKKFSSQHDIISTCVYDVAVFMPVHCSASVLTLHLPVLSLFAKTSF